MTSARLLHTKRIGVRIASCGKETKGFGERYGIRRNENRWNSANLCHHRCPGRHQKPPAPPHPSNRRTNPIAWSAFAVATAHGAAQNQLRLVTPGKISA